MKKCTCGMCKLHADEVRKDSIRICIDALAGYRTGPFRLSSFCEFCDGYIPGSTSSGKEIHKPDCPVLIARQLKAGWETPCQTLT